MSHWDEYYPRPQMRRGSFLPLNSGWTLNSKPITLPWPPESELSEFEGPVGPDLVYRNDLHLPKGFPPPGHRAILHFGAVDQVARVELNGYEMFRHEGGYLPFSGDITDAISADGNSLAVYVRDDLSHDYPYGKQSKDPHGMWYTPISGIWQSVWLEAVPETGAIESLRVTPDTEGLELHVETRALEFTVSIPEAGIELTSRRRTVRIDIPSPRLWTPEDPHLYALTVSTATDTVESYFALRTVTVERRGKYTRILLNGEPIFLNGVLDQGYYPGGIYLPWDPREYERDIIRMKELGYNTLRKHVKVEPEAFYYACDKLGMLVLQDMVNSGDYNFLRDSLLPTLGLTRRGDIEVQDSPIRREFFERHIQDTVRRLINHPCVIGYTIFNEGWGQYESDRLYRILHALDPTRFYIPASGWFAQREGDGRSRHIYFLSWRVRARDRKRFLIIGECGGFSRRVPGHLMEGRRNYGYGRKSSSEAALTARVLELYQKMVLPSIEQGLCGCIYTQLNDVEGETNGLYTYDREVLKVDAGALMDMSRQLREAFSRALED